MRSFVPFLCVLPLLVCAQIHAQTPCSGGVAAGYPCDQVGLQAFLPKSTWSNQSSSDCWGWKDPLTGKEYAIMGVANGTVFVDVSSPASPIYLGRLPTQTVSSSWRDIKVYRDHAYIVSEAANHGMQVFDLTQLRTVVAPPVIFTVTAHYPGFGRCHNIVINEDTGFAYAVGSNSCSFGPHMIDITTPATPVFAGCVSADGYTHDAQAVVYKGPHLAYQGREILFCSNEDTLTIWDVTDKGAVVMLVRHPYAGARYTHQGWLTEDQRYFLLGDELDEQTFGFNTRIRVFDVSDLTSPTLPVIQDLNTPAIDHNLYIIGGRVYLANYRAGIRVLDLNNLGGGVLPELGYFDTYPGSDSANFDGIWNVYPFFDSEVVIASGIGEGMFILQPDPSLQETRCVIPSPLAGATVAGDVAVTWKGWDPQGDAVTSTFDFSSDGGLSWTLATPAPASPAANPDVGRTAPFFGAGFEWDTRADGLGAAGTELVHIRVTITDGVNQRVCTQIMWVDNLPSCNINSPMAGSSIAGEVDIDFDGSNPDSSPMTSTFEFTTDAGVTYQSATAAASSPLANPDPLRPTPFSGAVFRWDTAADGLGLGSPQPAELRISLDSAGIMGTCTLPGLTVTNQPRCSIISPAPGVMVGGDLDITFEATDPSNDPLTSTFEHSTDGGATWLLSTPTPTSPLPNPDIGRPTPFLGVVFTWDTMADGVGAMGAQNVQFRIRVDDGIASSTCSLGVVFIDNGPTCAITSPPPGATVTRDVTIVFSGSDPTGDPVTSTFEYSTDAGTTYQTATAAAGSPTANPDPLRATPFVGVSFLWDSQGDGVGLVGAQSVTFRVTVDDGIGSTTCGQTLMVRNQPSCSITQPAPAQMLDGVVNLTFNGDDPAGDPVTSTIELSTDGGASWALATAAPGSPTMNPDPLRPTAFAGALFLWDSQADGVGLTGLQPVRLRVTADDGATSGSCSVNFSVDNQPTCGIVFPFPTLMVSGDVGITFDADDPSSDPVTSSFWWSTDGGTSFTSATASAASPLANPDPSRPTPFTSQVFIWDSVADAVGSTMVQTTTLQVRVDDGSATGVCQVSVEVDNVPPPPTCVLGLPAGTATNDVGFTVTAASPSASIVDIGTEYSTDGGATWAPCSMSLASPNPNPVMGVPVGPASFVWNSRGDGVGLVTPALGVVVRATIDDGFSPVAGTCQDLLDIDNTALCSTFCGDCNLNLVGPDILDSLEAARIAAGLVVPTVSQTGCCDVDSSGAITVLDSLIIAQNAAGLMVAMVCP